MNLRTYRFLFLRTAAAVALVAFGSSTAAAQERRALTLNVGELQTLPSGPVKHYSVSLEGIVDVRQPIQPGQPFVLVGVRPGTTTLLLINRDDSQTRYQLTVRGQDPTAPGAVLAGDPFAGGGGLSTAVAERENIRLDLYFVEISDSYNHQIGLSWPAFLGGGTLEAAIPLVGPLFASGDTEAMPGILQSIEGREQHPTVSASITGQPLPRLDLLQSNGWARVLRQSSVVTSNGTEANYQQEGELNFRIAGALTAEIRQINYGTQLRVLPRYDKDSGRIELKITAEISDLTPSVEGLPGRRVSQLNTTVNLELGQAIFLAGLYGESVGEGRSGLPGLSQIPILGALFGTHTRRLERVRNVAFIIPTVVDVLDYQRRDVIGDAFRVYEQYDGGADEERLINIPRRPGEREPRGTNNRRPPAQ